MNKRFYIVLMLFVFTFLLFNQFLWAGQLADQKLLEILQRKGILTEEEAETITGILKKEEQEKECNSSIEITYDDGIKFQTKDKKTASLRIGGRVQTDLKVFGSGYPVNNDFDVRRARLFLEGRVYEYFQYKIAMELEGSSNNRLVDAYVNFDYFPGFQFRVGQFKEPFSFESLTSSKYLPFNERSMISCLTPGRDVGIMVHGTMLDETFGYAAGIFNGEGRDADQRGQKDDKEVTGRLTVRPFAFTGNEVLGGLQIGGSYSYARLDVSDFKLKVRTPGRTVFFKIQPRAKFNMTQDVDSVDSYGFEFVYLYGPLFINAEYIKNKYDGVRLTDTDPFSFNLKGWHADILLMLTGEKPVMKGGVLERIKPRNDFNIKTGGWGAWAIALRYQEFKADQVVYRSLVNEGYSIRKADAFTVGVNWYLNSLMRVTLNYSRTRFRSPLFLGVHPKGYSYYEDTEHAFVTRFQLEF